MASGGFASLRDRSAVSRTIQGLITEIGFLGAGVMVRTTGEQTHLYGLTTASIWLTASAWFAQRGWPALSWRAR
jgi:uncharacterized membrane protein YhiD involved in acid resistance